MKKVIIAKGNHAMYFGVLGMSLCSTNAIDATIGSINNGGKAQFGIERGGFSGYLSINTTDIISNYSHGCLMRALNDGILGRVAHQIPYGDVIKGKLNEEVEVLEGLYKFSFKITKYERDRDHDCEMIDDLEKLDAIPDGENLSRVIELTITIVKPTA